MNKHTQGPWHVDNGLIASGNFNETKRIAVLVNQQQEPIDFPIIDIDSEFEEELANARLIAAAPELLQALNNLMQRAASDAENYAPEGNEPIWAFINDASDILNRVKGE